MYWLLFWEGSMVPAGFSVPAGNKLRELPGSVSGLRSLRALDVSGNPLQELPRGLAHIHSLQVPSPGASPAQPAALSWEQIQPMGGMFRVWAGCAAGDCNRAVHTVNRELFTLSKITLVYLLWYFLIFFTI